MENQKKRELKDLFYSVEQIGLVVEDLDSIMAGMRRIFNVEPDSLFEAEFKDTYYRGEYIDAPARIANYDYFGVQLEFIQPLGDGPSVWRDYINEGPHHGHCLHHIRFTSVDDVDEVTVLMNDLGIDKYQEVKSFVNPGGKGTYYDTVQEIGFLAETLTKKLN